MIIEFCMLVYVIAHYCFKTYPSFYNIAFLVFHFVSISSQKTELK